MNIHEYNSQGLLLYNFACDTADSLQHKKTYKKYSYYQLSYVVRCTIQES